MVTEEQIRRALAVFQAELTAMAPKISRALNGQCTRGDCEEPVMYDDEVLCEHHRLPGARWPL